MKRLLLTAALVAATCFSANPAAAGELVVRKNGVLLPVDLNSAQVVVQPMNGTLELSDEGVVYDPDTMTGAFDDDFMFVVDHELYDVSVMFTGQVVAGFVQLDFEYTKDKDKDDPDEGNGTNNGDGTITVDDGTVTVTGTIFQEPNTSIDFPEGTVVIGTDDSIDNDIAIIDRGEDDEIHTHDDVSDLDEVREILEGYPDGSIPSIVFVGHGAGGGVSLGDGDDDLDGQDLTNGDHQDILDLLEEKLADDATIYILGCDQFDEDDAAHIQDLANETGHAVVANEDPVWWPAADDPFYGEGNWVEVEPEEPEESDDSDAEDTGGDDGSGPPMP